MGLSRRDNKEIKKNRSVFQGSDFKDRQTTLAWINSEIDGANGLQQVKDHVKKFETNIVNTIFNLMGIE